MKGPKEHTSSRLTGPGASPQDGNRTVPGLQCEFSRTDGNKA